MVALKQLLAFPMYGTALWLAWVLSLETDSSHLVVLFAVALALTFAFWVIGSVQRTHGRTVLSWAAGLVAIVALGALFPLIGSSGRAAAHVEIQSLSSEPYSAARLASLRNERRPVFVDATAAWCVTCLVNERVALEDAAVRRAFQSRHVALLVADWTSRDPAITSLLEAHQRPGVPLYLYFAPGAPDAIVLPQILTPQDVLGALKAA